MKTTNKILSLACASALFASPVFADNNDSATVTVSGAILASLTVADATMTMPDLVLPDAGTPSSVAMSCAQTDGATTLAYTGNGSPFAHGDTSATAGNEASSVNATSPGTTGTCAGLTVGGDSTYNYMVSIGTTLTQPTTTAVVLSVPNCLTKSNGNLTGTLTAGADTIYCGATITATEGTASAGSYTDGGFTVTVVYD